MRRKKLHLIVLGGLFAPVLVASVFDLSRGGFLSGLFAWFALGGFLLYAAVSSTLVVVLRLAPRGVIVLHASLLCALPLLLVVGSVSSRLSRLHVPSFSRSPAADRKLELKRWWWQQGPGFSGTVFAEVEPTFEGILVLTRFSGSLDGMPLQVSTGAVGRVPVEKRQPVVLSLGYAHSGDGRPNDFTLSFQLESEQVGVAEIVEYATATTAETSAAHRFERPLPAPWEERPAPAPAPAPVGEDGPMRGEVTMGILKVDGPADLEALTAFFRSRKSGFLRCYERQFPISPDLRGQLSLSFVLLPDGRTDEVFVEVNTLGSAAMSRCGSEEVRGWVSPIKPAQDLRITLPLHLGLVPAGPDDLAPAAAPEPEAQPPGPTP